MNKKAKELGLENTNFVTPHGLDEEEHYTTAYELAKIADYALKNEKFKQIVGTNSYLVKIDKNYKTISNTNELLGYLNGVYGVKTGFTNGANRCLVTAAKRENMDIISVVLGADTKKDRTRDSIKILEYTFANYQMIDIGYMVHEKFDEIVENSEFNIVKGIDNSLKLDLIDNEISYYPVNKDDVKDLKVTANLEKTLIAPVNEGNKIGEIKVMIGEEIIYKLDICARNSIRKKEVWDYFKELSIKFFKNNLQDLEIGEKIYAN